MIPEDRERFFNIFHNLSERIHSVCSEGEGVANVYDAFDGFPKEGRKFLKGLRDNNSREWFHAHKDDYEKFIKKPSQIFLQKMVRILNEMMDEQFIGKIYRINRDVRFSKDKTPYKYHVFMSFSPKSSKLLSPGSKPSFHFSWQIDRVIAGVGIFDFSEATLNNYREMVADNQGGKNLESILSPICKKDGFTLSPPKLKRVPNAYDKNHPRGDLLRHKALLVWHESVLDDIFSTPAALKFIAARFKEMKPVYDWIDAL